MYLHYSSLEKCLCCSNIQQIEKFVNKTVQMTIELKTTIRCAKYKLNCAKPRGERFSAHIEGSELP